jgi:hypothetical protein
VNRYARLATAALAGAAIGAIVAGGLSPSAPTAEAVEATRIAPTVYISPSQLATVRNGSTGSVTVYGTTCGCVRRDLIGIGATWNQVNYVMVWRGQRVSVGTRIYYSPYGNIKVSLAPGQYTVNRLG